MMAVELTNRLQDGNTPSSFIQGNYGKMMS